ncbi:MAG: FimV/HubP family polar landmark protein [Gammaproteobacteria bacterium]|nr:FimV/HubP family polar landmark protein [Gammaproteobacteria bacterium]
MVRKLVVILTSVVLFAAAHVKALGLGEITIDSALNQPLAARIELLQLGGVRLDQITVQLASENDFERFSIEMESFLRAIRFDVESAGTDAYVHLSTPGPVREPYLSFVLETSWPSGRLLSEHTVLLDLPAFASNSSPVAVQQPVQAPQNSGNIALNQTVAEQPSSDLAASPMRLAAPADAAPAVNDGVLTAAPDADSASAAQPVADVLAAPAPIDAAATPVPVPPSQPAAVTPLANNSVSSDDTADTVTIGANDTLWDVAMQVRPDSSVSVQQTMLALQRLNSEAFIADNINMVRRGQVLRIPDIEQIRALSTREAMSEVSRQNQLFENRRNVPLSSQPVTAAPSQTPADASNGRGELSVVSVDAGVPATQSVSGGQSAELDARIAALENELAVQQEEADRVARQNAELRARLSQLEEQIDSAQEIIRLRDLELAQLQQALAQAPAVVEPEPLDPPPVITMAPSKSFLQTVLDTLIENTYALLAVAALLILIIVYALLRRNRSAGQEDFAELEEMQESSAEIATPVTTPATTASTKGSAAAPAIDPDMHEIFNFEDSDDAEMDGQRPDSDSSPHTTAVQELLEEADALLAYDRYEEAESLLQDAIVAEPRRADLRLKLLEVCVAKQDAIGFKLQETELLDLGDATVAPRIAELKAQLRGEVDHEILEEGEDLFLDELDTIDDMELALDLEAAATVDDDLVKSGYSVDASPAEVAEVVSGGAVAAAVMADEPQDTDIDEDDERTLEFSSAFDLSGDQEIDVPAVVEEVAETAAQEAEPSSDDENLLDFDFDFAIDSDTPDAAAPVVQTQEPAPSEDDPDHSVDFDFEALADEEQADAAVAVVEDSPAAENVTEETVAQEAAAEAAADEQDKAVAFDVSDEDNSNDLDFEFDSSQFDIAADEELNAGKDTAAEDNFDDLQFVDVSLLAEKSEQEEESGDDGVLEFLADSDEAATKLDLARAYYEMGDYGGAREILDEVVNEGNEEQVKDAQRLLAKI